MRRFAATSGGVSCLNQTTLPLASRISGPPGPTGESVTVAADPGCTTGEGSGVRKIEPLPPALRTATFGGCSPGSLLKLCSLSGCVEVMVSVGGVGADRRTVNDQRRTRWRVSVSVTVTPSPSSNGVAGTKLAPRSPEYARSLPGCAPLTDARTSTLRMIAGRVPRMLICVCGEASGVPGDGESAITKRFQHQL